MRGTTTKELEDKKNERVANMIFASSHPLYLNRLENNGRIKEDLKSGYKMVYWL